MTALSAPDRARRGSRAPAAPVTAGTLPGVRAENARASQANAVASTWSAGSPRRSLGTTASRRQVAREARLRSALSAPPPQTISSAAPFAVGAERFGDDAAAVSSASVAWHVLGTQRRTRIGTVETSIEPGGVEQIAPGALRRDRGEVGVGEQRRRAGAGRPRPVAAQAPAASNVCPVDRSHQWSSSTFAGPQSKPRVDAVGGRAPSGCRCRRD